MHYIPAQCKRDAVHKILFEKTKVATVAREYKVARKTIYSWINLYKEQVATGDKVLRSSLFEPKYVSGENHPRALYPKIELKVLTTIANNPHMTIRQLTDKLPGSIWTIWSIVNKYQLNTRSQRVMFAQRLSSDKVAAKRALLPKLTFEFVTKTTKLTRLQSHKIPWDRILTQVANNFVRSIASFSSVLFSVQREIRLFTFSFANYFASELVSITTKPKTAFAFVSCFLLLLSIGAVSLSGHSVTVPIRKVASKFITPAPVENKEMLIAQTDDESSFQVKSGDIVLSGRKNYKTTENPHFTVSKQVSALDSSRNKLAKVLGVSDSAVDETPEVKVEDANGVAVGGVTWKDNGKGVYEVEMPEEIAHKPGKYTISLSDESGVNITQDFTWGVLAINTNKSIYKPDETANLAIAVLDETGMMVCDAFVALSVTNKKSGETQRVTTSDGSIQVNPECFEKAATTRPDYETKVKLGGEAEYVMELTADTSKGKYSITDAFEVRKHVDFDIDRFTGTRIFPEANYPVIFTIVPDKDYKGLVEEHVPADFLVHQTTKEEIEDWGITELYTDYGLNGFSEKSDGKIKTLSWQVDWKKGETYHLSYVFDSPDTSPNFYLLGPLLIDGFEEIRQWHLAIDATDTNSPSSTTGDWTNGTNAYADAGGYAAITSGSPSASQTYGSYGFSLDGYTIDSVRVRYDAWSVGGTSTNQQRVPTGDGDNNSTIWDLAQIRVPTGNGDNDGDGTYTNTNCDAAWDCLNESPWLGDSSSDSDYLLTYTSGTGSKFYTFTHDAFSVPSTATISEIRVYMRIRDNSTGANSMYPRIKVNGTGYNSSTARNPGTTTTWYSSGWSTNPDTDSAWTPADINGTGSNPLQEFGIYGHDWDPAFRIYAVFAVVSYTDDTNKYKNVDETTYDDTDLIVGETDGGGYQLFTTSAFTIPTGSSITNLTLYYRAVDFVTTAAESNIRAAVKVNGTVYDSTDSGSDPGINPTTYSYAFTTNPNTGSAWTVADINGTGANPLQQIGVASGDLLPDVGVSMIYAQVNYTTVADEQISVKVTWDGGSTWSSAQTSDLTGTEDTFWYDVTAATAWTPTKLDNTNFKVQVEAVTVGDADEVRLDWVPVEVVSSVAGLTFSGYVYNYGTSSALTECDHTTPVNNIKLRIGGSTYTTSCNDTTGAWSFDVSGSPSAGGAIVWIDGETTKGAGVIYYDGSGDSTNNIFYDDSVTVTSDNTTAVTTTHMDVYDSDTEDAEGGDTDIPYTVTSGNLTVSSNHHLVVKLKTGVAVDSDVFDPGGTVTTQGTGNLVVTTDAKAYLDTATSVIAANTAIESSATLDVDATTTIGGDITVADTGIVNLDANVTVNGGDITVSSGGDVASSTGTVTMGASGTIGGGSTGSTFQLTNLTISAGATTTLGADADDILVINGDVSVADGGGLAFNDKTLDVNGGNLTTTGNGVVSCSSCTSGGLLLSGDGTTNGIGGGTGAITFYNLELDGTTNTTVIGSATITISNNLTIGSDRTLSGASSGTINVAGDWTNNGTFTANSSDVVLNGVADTNQTVDGNTTFYDLTATTGDRIITFGSGDTFIIDTGGTFSVAGDSCSALISLRTTTGASATFTKTGSISFSYVDYQDLNVSASGATISNSVDSGGNTNLPHNANACLGASTDSSSTATSNSFQRKSFYDSANERYWVFFHDGDEIEARFSSDGTNWNVDDDHLAYDTNDFSVVWGQIGTTEYVWLAVAVPSGDNQYDIVLRRGELSTTGVAWDSADPTVVAFNGTAADASYSYPYITLEIPSSGNPKLWIGSRYYDGTYYVYKVVRSVNAAETTWTSAAFTFSTNTQLSDNQSNANVYGNIVPLSGGNMYATYVANTALEGCTYDETTNDRWENSGGFECTGSGDGEQDAIDTVPASVTKNMSAVSDSSGNVHLAYIDGDGTSDQVSYKKWNGTAWGSATRLDAVEDPADTNDSYVTISLNTGTNTGDIFVAWVDLGNNHVYYKQYDASATDWLTVEDWQATGVNKNVVFNYSGSDLIFGIWTEGSATPFSVGYEAISISAANAAPSAPQTPYVNNTTAQSGLATPVYGLIDHTPAFSAIFDDADTSDTATYYEIEVGTDSDWAAAETWDTGKTALSPACNENSRCADVVYSSLTDLVDGTTYYWRIRFWDNSDAEGAWSETQQFSMNNAPTISSVSLNGGSNIDLTADTTTSVSFTATITDLDGSGDIDGENATGKMYRSGVGGAQECEANNANCYAVATCSISNCSGNSCTATCTASVAFFADATDAGTYASEYWRAWIQATDEKTETGAGFSAADSPEMNSLLTISTTATIAYGAVSSGSNSESSNQSVVVTNVGNRPLDIRVSGDDMCTDYPTCSGSTIGVDNQEYLGSTFTYGTGTVLSTSPTLLSLGIAKSAVIPSNSTGTVYWGIGIPSNTLPGTYSGSNTITSIAAD